MYKVFSERRATYGARNLCGDNLASLPRPRDEAENDFLADMIGHDNYLILDLTDEGSEGAWRWFSDVTEVTWEAWLSGEPNGNETENCAALYTRNGGKSWVDVNCRHNFAIICEKCKY